MRKSILVILSLVMLIGFTGCAKPAESSAKFKEGTYTAAANGNNGPVTVEVVLSENAVTSVAVVEHSETAGISDSAISTIPQSIVDHQSLDIETVSGATVTSKAILAAVEDCLSQAGGSKEDLSAKEDVTYEKTMTAGTYTAVRHGHHSDVKVEVKVSENAIESVTVVEEGETYGLADPAIEQIPSRVVEHQSVAVDTIAGATYTSAAIINAVKDCLTEAGSEDTVKAFSTVAHETYEINDYTVDCDIVVAGAGMAGLAAALTAQEAGANVVLIEKLPFVGGTSMTSAMGFATTTGTEESVQAFVDYRLNQNAGIFKNTHTDDLHPNLEMVTTLAENSHEALTWLGENGLRYIDRPLVFQGYNVQFAVAGYSYEGYAAPDAGGVAMEQIFNKFEELGGTIITELAAEHIIMEDNKVVGLTASGNAGNYTFNCDSVILATGGFGANQEMVETYAPAYIGETNWTIAGNTGDAITMGLEVGAAVYESGMLMGGSGQTFMTDLEMISPYSDKTTPKSSIYVNTLGLRVNSEDPSFYSPAATYANPDVEGDYYWVIINQAEAEATGYIDLINAADDWGVEVHKADTIDGLANQIKIPAANLRYTVNTYNEYCRNGVDEQYGKGSDYLVEMSEGPYYAVKATMNYFGTVGGLITNTDAAVVDVNGQPIVGLYAAGEASNGAFFNMSYCGGFSLDICLTMGRIAGQNAAEFVK